MNLAPAALTGDEPSNHRLWRQLLLAVLLAALILIPRSILTSHALSETLDDDFHLSVGVQYLRGGRLPAHLNDPPLGGALGAIPILPGISHTVTLRKFSALHEPTNPWSRERILMTVAIWKTILFLPAIGLIFYWLARVYNTRAGWFGAALLVVEPNFAGHIPVCAIDVIGVEAILFGCFFIWRYFEKPTVLRAAYTAAIVATCMMIKHTAILLPAVAVAFAGMAWIIRPLLRGDISPDWKEHWRNRVAGIVVAGVVFPLMIFALTKFDMSPVVARTAPAAAPRAARKHALTTQPAPAPAPATTTVFSRHRHRSHHAPKQKLTLLQHRIPGGMYYSSILTAAYHTSHGHPEFFNGIRAVRGWWYYFPILSLYKIPIPNLLLLVLALSSMFWIKPRWREWSLFIPMVFWTALMIHSPIDIGFRHFLPPYAFMLMMAARLMVTPSARMRACAWICAIATAINGALYHPDYIAYLNFPREKPQLKINDSNLDWGQSMFEILDFVKAHPDRPIAIRLFYGRDYRDPQTTHYFADLPANAHLLTGAETLPGHEAERPTHGLLIISPIRELAIYEATWLDKKETEWGGWNPYEALKPYRPVAVIGHNMAVYDLDAMSNGKGFTWPRNPGTTPATEPAGADPFAQ